MKTSTTETLNWLCRDFKTSEFWKLQARCIYLSSVHHIRGSENARKLLSGLLEKAFTDFEPKPLSVEKWNKGGNAIERVDVLPPPTQDDTVNWEWIADYFLQAASVPWKEYEELNGSSDKCVPCPVNGEDFEFEVLLIAEAVGFFGQQSVLRAFCPLTRPVIAGLLFGKISRMLLGLYVVFAVKPRVFKAQKISKNLRKIEEYFVQSIDFCRFIVYNGSL